MSFHDVLHRCLSIRRTDDNGPSHGKDGTRHHDSNFFPMLPLSELFCRLKNEELYEKLRRRRRRPNPQPNVTPCNRWQKHRDSEIQQRKSRQSYTFCGHRNGEYMESPERSLARKKGQRVNKKWTMLFSFMPMETELN
jgi:hypothetical protein